MFDKKYIKQSFKYLLIFMLSMLSLHIIGNNKLSLEQNILISIVNATSVITIDYLAPTIVTVPDNIIQTKCV